jgi:flagellar FliL protein
LRLATRDRIDRSLTGYFMAEAATIDATPKKGMGKLLILIGIAVAVLAAGGAAAYLLLGKKDVSATGEPRAEARRTPVFVDLDMFTVNLRVPPDSDESERYFQVKLVAEMRDAGSGEVLKNMMPSVRNEVLLLLGGKTAAELASREGKETLARDIVAAVNKPLAGTSAAGGVQGVNFTYFIIQ